MTHSDFYKAALPRYMREEEEPTAIILDIYNDAVQQFGEENVELSQGCSESPQETWSDDILGELHFNRSLPAEYMNAAGLTEEGYRWFKANIESVYTKTLYKKWAIILHFDKATVTNEKGQSTEIYDLFVRIPLNRESYSFRNSIYMLRSTYTPKQFMRGYCHSHIMTVPSNKIDKWSPACLGRSDLKTLADRHMLKEDWYAFFVLVDQLVHTESLQGVPYIPMSEVGAAEMIPKMLSFSPDNTYIAMTGEQRELLQEFLSDYMQSGRFKVGFFNGSINLAMPFNEWHFGISEALVEWSKGHGGVLDFLLMPYTVKDGQICRPGKKVNNSEDDLNALRGKGIITFKGREYKLKIHGKSEVFKTRLLKYEYAMKILYLIMSTIHVTFGNLGIESKNQWIIKDPFNGIISAEELYQQTYPRYETYFKRSVII